MNLASAFCASAEKHAQKIGVFWGDAEFSYAQIQGLASQGAARLRRECNVKPGDRVGVWLRNRPEYFPALFAILQLGAVAVPINHFLTANEVDFILADAGIDVLVAENAFESAAKGLISKRPSLRVAKVENLFGASGELLQPLVLPEVGEQDLALIIYTSGTTGRPKGAMLTHGNLLHNVESCRQVLAAVDHDRFVLLLPMFHSFMLCVCIFLPLLVGGSVVLVKSLHPPKAIIQEIIDHRPTILPAIPQFFRALTDPSIPAQLPLRLCISGAAPLPSQVLKEFNHKFAVPLLEGYGLSEASPVVSFNPIKGPWKAGSIGVPIPNVEVGIQNDSGEVLAPGQIGELVVKGGNVMRGYWNQPEATAQAFRKGWLLTGDVGYRDQDGYFYITDRKKDMLLVNGINVYPREIEEVIYQYPGIREAAVISRPDPRKGEQPVAYVSVNEGVTLHIASLIKFLRQRLANYKVPREIQIMPALPRNGTGKILKTALRDHLRTSLGNQEASQA